ncbi:hypothetical protein BJ944DRAFT_155636 [Cunninghamella echinulata]|nr:hypothetical protein BJ944DRAFT_155636 [Cunninghamella echinulata]
MATVTIDTLEKEGWYLSPEGIELVKEELENENCTLKQFIDAAKDIDLRDIADKGFRKGDTITKVTQLPSPLVLQIVSIQNIALPSIQQFMEKPRLLRVVFTDGSKKKWIGAEMMGQIECINLQTPPGTKILVTKPIDIVDQIVQLGPGMLKSLGGQVQDLIQAWKAGKQFIQRSKRKNKSSLDGTKGESNDDDDAPPPFIPFKIKVKYKKRFITLYI